jgi:hypothetical protein
MCVYIRYVRSNIYEFYVFIYLYTQYKKGNVHLEIKNIEK